MFRQRLAFPWRHLLRSLGKERDSIFIGEAGCDCCHEAFHILPHRIAIGATIECLGKGLLIQLRRGKDGLNPVNLLVHIARLRIKFGAVLLENNLHFLLAFRIEHGQRLFHAHERRWMRRRMMCEEHAREKPVHRERNTKQNSNKIRSVHD